MPSGLQVPWHDPRQVHHHLVDKLVEDVDVVSTTQHEPVQPCILQPLAVHQGVITPATLPRRRGVILMAFASLATGGGGIVGGTAIRPG